MKLTQDEVCSWVTKVEVINEAASLNIPGEFDGAKLVRIGAEGKKGYNLFGETISKNNIREIEIPDTVQKIENCTFVGMNSLSRITLPRDLKALGRDCFQDSSVTNIEVADGNSVFSKDGSCIYRRDNYALVIGIVEGGELHLSEKVKELRSDSELIGGTVKRIYMSSDLQYLRGTWANMVENEECVYTFTGQNPPQFVSTGENAELFSTGVKVEFPETSESAYQKWLSENGLTLDKNKKTVLMTSKEDDFLVKDGVLIKYSGGYSVRKKIVLPKNVKTIGKKAFALTKEEKKKPIGTLATLELTIPKNVKLEKKAFAYVGSMKITLEEGRKVVEEEAFCDSSHYRGETEVILPNSVTVLEKRSFFNLGGGSRLTVRLGNSLRDIKEYALYGVCVNELPDSIRTIADGAFGEWDALPENLPEGVETLGNEFLTLLPDGKVYIPASVEKIAKNAVLWEHGATEIGYIVAEDNPYYRSDEKGNLYSKKTGKRIFEAKRQV